MSEELVITEPEANRELTVLVRAEDPADFVRKSREIATALVDVVEQQQLFTMISNRKHPRVEAWTFLGSMMGAFGSAVFAVEEWTRPVKGRLVGSVYQLDPEGDRVIGWEARVEARTAEGAVVGAAEAMCIRAESTWKNRDDFALRSMAQTRATSKALRQPLGFLMQLAGYDPTPKEEMPTTPPEPRERVAPSPTKDEFEKMMSVLGKAEALIPELWHPTVVAANASRVFGRPIERLEDLSRAEVERISEGAASWLASQMAKDEQQEGGDAEG